MLHTPLDYPQQRHAWHSFTARGETNTKHNCEYGHKKRIRACADTSASRTDPVLNLKLRSGLSITVSA